MLKKIAMRVYQSWKKWSSAALLKSARKLYQDDTLQWKSAGQKQAITTVMSWTEQMMIILSIRAEKSLLLMLPCILPDAEVTILILPLVSLQENLLHWVWELRINYLVWALSEQQDVPLMFITVKAACTKQFHTYTHKLVTTQDLNCIVFDEAHLIITASDYCQAMINLALIRNVRTQFVYLTATLSLTMQATFEEQNNLMSSKVIQIFTNRQNLFYMMQWATEPKSLLKKDVQKVRNTWQTSGLLDQT